MKVLCIVGTLCSEACQSQYSLSDTPAEIFRTLHGTSCDGFLLLYGMHTDKDPPLTAACAPSENASAPFRSSCSALERLRFRVSLCLSHRHFLQYVCRQESLLCHRTLPLERLQCFSRRGCQ